MGPVRVETPTQVLARYTIFLFTLILLLLHITISIYYFSNKENGVTNNSNIGFLEYVKRNAESLPIQSLKLFLQPSSSKIKSTVDQSLFQWAGNTAGFLCNTTYQTTECASTDSPFLEVLETKSKEFSFLTTTYNSISNYAATFQITRCADLTCSAYTSTAPTLNIINSKSTISFTALPSSQVSSTYIQGFQANLAANITSISGSTTSTTSGLLLDIDTLFYSIAVGITAPCLNKDYSSILPTSLSFPLYYSANGCDRFSNISNVITLTQATVDQTLPQINLDFETFFRENEMSLALMDAGLSFPSTKINLNIYLVPKITLVNKDQGSSNTCVLVDDISLVPSYENFIIISGRVMFILKQIFISLLFPIPLVEFALGLIKNPAVVLVGIVSKILCVVMIILFIIEGLIVNHKYSLKVNMQNRIRGVGWNNCFTDSLINDKLAHFPSVFSAELDDYCYMTEIYMYLVFAGLFILIIIFAKLGIDVYLQKQKNYGEYDDDFEEQQDKTKKSQTLQVSQIKYNSNNFSNNLNSNSQSYQRQTEMVSLSPNLAIPDGLELSKSPKQQIASTHSKSRNNQVKQNLANQNIKESYSNLIITNMKNDHQERLARRSDDYENRNDDEKDEDSEDQTR